MDDSELDPDALDRWSRIMNKRGHAGRFARDNSTDLEIVERSTARDWCGSILAEFGIKVDTVCTNADDPPDCFACHEGRKIGRAHV